MYVYTTVRLLGQGQKKTSLRGGEHGVMPGPAVDGLISTSRRSKDCSQQHARMRFSEGAAHVSVAGVFVEPPTTQRSAA